MKHAKDFGNGLTEYYHFISWTQKGNSKCLAQNERMKSEDKKNNIKRLVVK